MGGTLPRRAVLALAFSPGLAIALPRMTERALGDTAVIQLPAHLEAGRYMGYDDELMHRVAFQFSSSYFWASMGGVTRYKQLMVVSVLAADADESALAATPRDWPISYEARGPARTRPLGAGQLTLAEGLYTLGVDREPAVLYLYVDRARRLQILWHAVTSEHDTASAPALIERMAASFRLLRDPAPILAERRAQPARMAALHEQRRATARAMLAREGYGAPEPGRPVWRRGAWLEWMDDPEPRYQLLVPLGRVRPPGPGVANRPRPRGDGTPGSWPLPGVGWREFAEGQWQHSNRDHGYLPMPGIAAALSAQQQDTGAVYVHYVRTVRVHHEDDPARLQSLDWFFAALPQVQQRWRAGTLVGPGQPEPEEASR